MQSSTLTGRKRLPSWLKRPVTHAASHDRVVSCLSSYSLRTVCVEARCPNRSECYSRGTATFLIMGNRCTRNCLYCGVQHGQPLPLELDEGARVAEAVARMGLKHVVITSVTRDDLPDGGAAHFASVISSVRASAPGATIEVLVPDFNGSVAALDTVLKGGPDVLNHNIETVPRLFPRIRPSADYVRSLHLLDEALKRSPEVITKSGLMVGLGETENEVMRVLIDLREVGVSLVTIGQYLQPTQNLEAVEEFIAPEQFKRYEAAGNKLGFYRVFAGPFVRSSYRAGEIAGKKLQSDKVTE